MAVVVMVSCNTTRDESIICCCNLLSSPQGLLFLWANIRDESIIFLYFFFYSTAHRASCSCWAKSETRAFYFKLYHSPQGLLLLWGQFESGECAV